MFKQPHALLCVAVWPCFGVNSGVFTYFIPCCCTDIGNHMIMIALTPVDEAWYTGKSTCHYSDILVGEMAFQITSLTIVYSTVYSGADQRKHQNSASLAFVYGIHRWQVKSSHKWPVTRKMFPFDDVIIVQNTSKPSLQRYLSMLCEMYLYDHPYAEFRLGYLLKYNGWHIQCHFHLDLVNGAGIDLNIAIRRTPPHNVHNLPRHGYYETSMLF